MITAGPRDKLLNVELVLGMVSREPDPVGVSRSPFEKSLWKVPSRSSFDMSLREVPSESPFGFVPPALASFHPRHRWLGSGKLE